jgi:hypothetical protein
MDGRFPITKVESCSIFVSCYGLPIKRHLSLRPAKCDCQIAVESRGPRPSENCYFPNALHMPAAIALHRAAKTELAVTLDQVIAEESLALPFQ